jgi:hypothetical protein
MHTITFRTRWREELEAISDEGKLIFEFTVGRFQVYFPDHQRWLAIAPEWAKGKWEFYKTACENWCRENKFPMSLTNDAHVYEERTTKVG